MGVGAASLGAGETALGVGEAFFGTGEAGLDTGGVVWRVGEVGAASTASKEGSDTVAVCDSISGASVFVGDANSTN